MPVAVFEEAEPEEAEVFVSEEAVLLPEVFEELDALSEVVPDDFPEAAAYSSSCVFLPARPSTFSFLAF